MRRKAKASTGSFSELRFQAVYGPGRMLADEKKPMTRIMGFFACERGPEQSRSCAV
ncbi:hypothetical protein PSAC2689_90140 [Paraburkholderia sacchari]